MLNISTYSVRDIQTFLQLCQIAEAEGVTDLRFVRQQLQNRLDSEARVFKARPGMRTAIRKTKQESSKHIPCPSCGHATGITSTGEGLIRACPKCRWSALVEG